MSKQRLFIFLSSFCCNISYKLLFLLHYRDDLHLQSRTNFDEMCSKDEEITKLRNKNESLNRKCTRMREYVKQLTTKCKEWDCLYNEKENFLQKYEASLVKITELTNQMNTSCAASTTSLSSSKGDSNCMHCQELKSKVDKETASVTKLQSDLARKDKTVKTLKLRLLERSR